MSENTDLFGGANLDTGDGQDSGPAVNAKYAGRLDKGFEYATALVEAGWLVDKEEVDASPLTVIRGRKMRSTAAVLYHPEIANAAVKLYAKGSLVTQNCHGIGDDSAPDPSDYGFRLEKTW